MEQKELQNPMVDSEFGGNGAGIDLGSEEETESAATSIFTTGESANTELEIQKEPAAKIPGHPAFAKVEKSLASIGFFTASSRRSKNQKMKRVEFTREIDGKRVPVSAEIHPSAMLGLPVTADQDKFLAFQQIVTTKLQAEGKVTNPIRFKSSELLRLLNTSTRTGKITS